MLDSALSCIRERAISPRRGLIVLSLIWYEKAQYSARRALIVLSLALDRGLIARLAGFIVPFLLGE